MFKKGQTNLKADLHFQSHVAVTYTVQKRALDIVWRLSIVEKLCTQCSSRAQHSPDECFESKSGSSRFRTWRVSDVQPTRVSKASAVVACGFQTSACGAERTRTTSKGLEFGSLLTRLPISWKNIILSMHTAMRE